MSLHRRLRLMSLVVVAMTIGLLATPGRVFAMPITSDCGVCTNAVMCPDDAQRLDYCRTFCHASGAGLCRGGSPNGMVCEGGDGR